MSEHGMTGVAGLAPTTPVSQFGLSPRVRDDRLFFGLVAGLILLAWLSLWRWQESPHGRFLGHEEIEGVASLGDYTTLLAVFVVGWTLMTIAMMLPTSLPLVAFFRAFVRSRPNPGALVFLLVVGYVSVWAVFAGLVHVGDLALHQAVHQFGPLEANAWVISAGTLLFAGAYQFTGLKFRCLDKCRSPVGFVMQNWRGRHERLEALRLGVRHGVFCLGCCWALMLLMFAVGVGNIGLMLALAAVMATEKNAPWGRRLSAPLGVVLIGCGVALAVAGTVEGSVL